MENASKALVIAGGMLIAVLILSLIVYMATSASRMAEEQDARTLTEQTTEFNRSYEAYNKKLMYGTDVISVVNKANDNNHKYQDDEDYRITITILDNNGNQISISLDNEFKIKVFECVEEEIGYNPNTGRINRMTFKMKYQMNFTE